MSIKGSRDIIVNLGTRNKSVAIKDGKIVLSGSAALEISGSTTATRIDTNDTADTNLASESYVVGKISALVASAPDALNTLDELANALGDDANYAATTSTALGNRLRVDTASQGLTTTQKSNARTNLGLGTAATSATGDFATAAQGTKADTAYSWGNHASAGYLTSQTSHADVVVDGDFTSNGLMKRTGAGTYSIVTDNSSNWNTAYGWGNHASAGYLTSESDTLSSVTGRGASTSTAVTFNGNVTLGNSADLIFSDLAGTFPTSGKGFDWTLNNDGARIYAIQPSSDSIDLVFQLRDNATTNDRFVFHVKEWQGVAYDKYPLIIAGGTQFNLKDSALYTNDTLRLSNAGVLQNVTGNISMFTNNSGYLTSVNNTNWSGTDLSLANGGTGASLSDPNADRIMFWDDSASTVTWLAAGSNITISGTTISATNTTYSVGDGGLTEINFTSALNTKLASIASNADAYGSWTISDGTNTEGIGSGDTLKIVGTGATTATYNAATNTLTINSTDTDTNTTYSVGDGGLTQKNFTTTLYNKLNAIAASADNYGGWSLSDGTASGTIGSGATLTLRGSGASTISYDDASKTITINSTDNNTTYSVGDGGLTQYNFTAAYKSKLDGIASGATANAGTVTSVATGTGLTGGTITSTGTISLSHLGFQNLTDPNADRIAFWDDSAGAFAWLALGSNLSISGTTINATNTTYSVGNGGLTEINFTSALNTKLAGIEAGATGDQTAAEILTLLKTVDGAGSGLDADLLDGNSSAAFATAAQGTKADTAYGWGNHASAGYLTTLPSSTGTLTTFTNAVTIESSSDGILNLKQTGLGGTAGTANGGWNYIQFFDSESDRQGYFGIDSSGHFLFNPEVSGGEVRMNRLLRVSANIVATGTLSASGYNSSNWDTAYGWGNHASAGYATTTDVTNAVAGLVGSAPDALNTLNELATALGNDANFATTTATALGNRLRVDTAAQGLTATQQSNARTNLGLGTAATTAATAYATAAQGTKADTAYGWGDHSTRGYLTSYTDTNTVTSIRRDNTGTYRTGNINLVGGANVTITETSAGVFSFAATDTNTTYSVGDGGLTEKNFTSALKTKLDGIAASANNYSLPVASSTVLGGIKVGTNLSIDANGVLSATDTNTTYSVGDGGLTQKNFTTTLYNKLNAIAASADNYGSWTISDGTNTEGIGSGATLTVRGGGASTVAYDAASNTLTISSTDTDTNTTYSVGDGGLTQVNFTTAFRDKLNGIAAGAQTNQNAFSNVAVSGQSTVAADNATDTLTLVAGSNVTITTNATTDAITISATDTNTTYSVGNGGLTEINFTSALNTKLAGIATGANNYSLPTATSTVLGGVKIGSRISIASGVISADVQSDNNFTSAYKTKIDGIEAGATADQTASEILTAIKTVDGASSGLDADLLDGLHAADFALSSHTHNYLKLTGGTLTGDLNVQSSYINIGAASNTSLVGLAANESTLLASYNPANQEYGYAGGSLIANRASMELSWQGSSVLYGYVGEGNYPVQAAVGVAESGLRANNAYNSDWRWLTGDGIGYRDFYNSYAPANYPDFATSVNHGGFYVGGTITSEVPGMGGYAMYSSKQGVGDVATYNPDRFEYTYGQGNLALQPMNGIMIAFDWGTGGLMYDANSDACSAGDFQPRSDRRIKDNIVSIQSGLDVVTKLQGVEYDLKSNGAHKSGFIAQEVQEVIPHAVTKDHNDTLTLSYNSIIAYQNEAIKELKGMIDELKAEIQILKNK